MIANQHTRQNGTSEMRILPCSVRVMRVAFCSDLGARRAPIGSCARVLARLIVASMGENDEPQPIKGVFVRPAATERERDLTRGYVYGRFGVEIDDRIAEAIVFSLTPPREPCSLTFTSLDGTECRIKSEEFRPLFQ